MRWFLVRDGEQTSDDEPTMLDGGPPLATDNHAEVQAWETRRPGLRYLTHDQLGMYNSLRHAGRSHASAIREVLPLPTAVNQ